MRKKKHEEHENMERWLVSYADFITLLFAFFVVMYSTSSVNAGKLRAVAEAMNAAFHPYIALSATNIRMTTQESGNAMIDIGLKNYFKKVEAEIKKMNASEGIKVIQDRRGVVIRVEDSLAFETGQAEILSEFSARLDKIAEVIAKLPNQVQIEGHTDNIPIKTPLYPSNWELSTARAIHIARYFADHHAMNPSRISVAGYGEFKPLAPNDTLEGRAKNRRVEIIVQKEEQDSANAAAQEEIPAPKEAPQ